MRGLVIALLLSVAVPLGSIVSGAEEPVLVSAAISLTDALREIERAYRAQGGGPLRFNFAGSNVLARQIANGAPADLFISADQAQMDYAADRGAIDVEIPLLKTRLAVVTPPGNGSSVSDVAALSRLRRIAIGDPAAVPAGVYARQFLQKTGQWDALRPKLLPLVNVRAALKAAQSGAVDAAIVYESDAASTRDVDLAFVISGLDAPQIIYPAAIVKASTNKLAASRFLEFLRGGQAATVFERYRFCRVYVPSDPAPPASGPCASAPR
jgi:molybdate transport system substrate-binding protein